MSGAQFGADDLILVGSRWVDNWTTIQRVVPSPETVFERRESAGSIEGLPLTDGERRVLESLDGLREVTAVARQCDLTEGVVMIESEGPVSGRSV